MRLLAVPQANTLYGNDCIKRSAGAYANVRREFRELIDHLRSDLSKIDEPKAQALFETTAEVISGLDTAFKHYEEKSEKAWK
jgi:hypothetical protein